MFKKLAILTIGCTFIFTELLAGGCLAITLPVVVDYVINSSVFGG